MYMLLFHVFTFYSEQKEHLLFSTCYTYSANNEHFCGGKQGSKWPENFKVERENNVIKL